MRIADSLALPTSLALTLWADAQATAHTELAGSLNPGDTVDTLTRAGMGLDGNLYYTVNNPNRLVTIGKVDGKTGAVSYLRVDGRNGEAATAHGGQ